MSQSRLSVRIYFIASATVRLPNFFFFVTTAYNILRLARTGAHEQHPAVTKPDMGGLHDYRHTAQQNDLVAPVELVSFARSEAQRDVGRRRRLSALLGPSPGVAPHGIVATVVAAPA